MGTIKKSQHYVWREYLRPWSTKDRIWCNRKEKIFPSNLTGIAVENYFYKLQEITEQQVKSIEALFIRDTDPMLQKLNQNWIEVYTFLFKIRHQYEQSGHYPSKIKEEIERLVINLEEDLQMNIEQSAITYLNSLRDEDTSFYNTIDDSVQFNIYLTNQYTRTKNMKVKFVENMKRLQEDHPEHSNYHHQLTNGNPDSVWSLVHYIIATNVAANMFLERDSFNMVVLRNKSAVNLITGDQPVINTFAVGLDAVPPDDLEFYYPITPKIAILITKQPKYSGIKSVILTEQNVSEYNNMIIDQSHEQIFSIVRENLEICS